MSRRKGTSPSLSTASPSATSRSPTSSWCWRTSARFQLSPTRRSPAAPATISVPWISTPPCGSFWIPISSTASGATGLSTSPASMPAGTKRQERSASTERMLNSGCCCGLSRGPWAKRCCLTPCPMNGLQSTSTTCLRLPHWRSLLPGFRSMNWKQKRTISISGVQLQETPPPAAVNSFPAITRGCTALIWCGCVFGTF